MSMLEEVRTRILGGAGAGILSNLQVRAAELRAGRSSSPAILGEGGILKGPLITEFREKGVLGTVMARVEKFRAPPAPAPPAAPPPPIPEAKRRVAVESIEGLYSAAIPAPTFAVTRPEWVPEEKWERLTEEQKRDLASGAGLGFESVREYLKWMDAEMRVPGKFEKGKIAVSV